MLVLKSWTQLAPYFLIDDVLCDILRRIITHLNYVNEKRKIVVGLSGGVDSTTCAHLLKEAGHDVTGIYMRNWQEAGIKNCPVNQDLRDAESCAKHIGIPSQQLT